MVKAKMGDEISVHFVGVLEDGSVFDTSFGKKPLKFTIGQGEVIPGLEKSIIGMKEGDIKVVTIPPEDGYGKYEEEAVRIVKKSDIELDVEPQVGMKLQAQTQKGEVINITVKDVTDNTLTVDANHPFAGKELTLKITLLKIF